MTCVAHLQQSIGSVTRNNKKIVICPQMPQSVKDSLLSAFRYLLKPLVRLALKNSVGYPEFGDALKRAYVDVASKQIRAFGREVTSEGISLIAGITSVEVQEVIRSDSGVKIDRAVRVTNPLPAVLGGWHTDVRFTGPYGVLRDLEFAPERSTPDGNASFTDLAATYCSGVSPKALLDELIRTGCVQDVGNGYFRAIKRLYIPDPLSADSIIGLAHVVHNICETLEINLRSESMGGKGLVERTVYTVHGIKQGDMKEFDKFIRARGQIFADDIDNWLSDRDQEGQLNGVKTGVGFYHYIVNEDDETALSKELLN